MARSTYGERMSLWEFEEDERYWTKSLKKALESSDTEEMVKLVKEGIEDKYSFVPFYNSAIILELYEKYNH